ncbi:hypothetical protein [Trebonia kvetii]|uniref:hypothetical protein n=1 Tax=Trebonia kvetii TaxID=2480626 RepID=UPI001C9E33E4|nr:hypothetical protein [Trebonia kvetii]
MWTKRAFANWLSAAASAASRDRDWLMTSCWAASRCASASGISTCTVMLVAAPPSSIVSRHSKTKSETRQEIVTPDSVTRSCCAIGKSG